MKILISAIFLIAFLSIDQAGKAQVSASNKGSSSIRSVDFLNFTYTPSCTSSKVTTKNGVYDRALDPQQDVPVHFTINDVLYGDLRGDGAEQAIVLTGCNLGGTGYWTEAFLFELRAGTPVKLETIGGGDRAMGGIASLRIEGHAMKVAQQYGRALCCADYIENTTYVLRGNRLVAVKSERVVAGTGKAIQTLRFEKGSSFGIINGEVGGDTVYEFRARRGQVLVIEPLRETETIADLGFAVMDSDGITLKQERDGTTSTMRLQSDGRYTLVVSSNLQYTLKVTIR